MINPWAPPAHTSRRSYRSRPGHLLPFLAWRKSWRLHATVERGLASVACLNTPAPPPAHTSIKPRRIKCTSGPTTRHFLFLCAWLPLAAHPERGSKGRAEGSQVWPLERACPAPRSYFDGLSTSGPTTRFPFPLRLAATHAAHPERSRRVLSKRGRFNGPSPPPAHTSAD